MNRKALLLALLAPLAALVAEARPVSAEQAVRGAEAWAARGTRMRRNPSGTARTLSINGTNLVHLVALEDGGFVAMSTDDALPPIMGFSGSGELPDLDDRNPLWTLLGGDAAKAHGLSPRDAARRSPAHRDRTFKPKPRRRTGRATRRDRQPLTWKTLGEESTASADGSASGSKSLLAASSYIEGETELDDVRVAPLLQSKWNQSTVGGKKVYNYYTPNGYVCGCVATALAQLMRYHEFPTASVKPQEFTCYTGTSQTETNLVMKGGVYDWANMPLVPTSAITDTEREAIGRLCYDAGVAMRMSYGFASGQSGTYGGFEFDPLKNVFGYKSAEAYLVGTGATVPETVITNAILANLDAGYPVLLGIENTRPEGHAIVADGYGFSDETLYCHLNMGWSGSWDYWYALPSIPALRYNFSLITSVVYNIFPEQAGSLVTGRVTDPYGNPVANASVTAQIAYPVQRGWQTLTWQVQRQSTTDANGIYAVLTPDGTACTVTLTAAYDDWANTNGTQTSATNCVSPVSFDFETGSFWNGEQTVGNSWGNDLAVGPTNIAAAAVSSFAAAADTGRVSLGFSGTAATWYQVEWSEHLTNTTWNVCTNLLLGTEGAALLSLPKDDTLDSCFYRIRPKVE